MNYNRIHLEIQMIINSFRILAVVLLFAVMLIHEIPFKKMYKDSIMQFYLAVLCVSILMIFDNITGFVVTFALLIVYFRIYNAEIRERNIIKIQEIKEKEEKEKEEEKTKKCNEGDKCKLENPHKKSIIVREINNVEEADGLNPYITEEHLISAQNNVINDEIYNNEIGELSSEYKNARPLYKSQGLNDNKHHLEGYDYYNSYYGKLQFESINN